MRKPKFQPERVSVWDWVIGGEYDNVGTQLTVGQEWITTDGFLLRQVSVHQGRKTGRVLVLDFNQTVQA